MVGRWQGAATRSLVMHADPLAAYAYRWLGGIAPIARPSTAVRLVLAASARARPHVRPGHLRQRPARRAADGRRRRECRNDPHGRRSAAYSRRRLRSPDLRASSAVRARPRCQTRRCCRPRTLLGRKALGNGASGGRRSARRSATSACCWSAMARSAQQLELLAERIAQRRGLPRITDRDELARLLASADALVHGCEAETFCLVAAEARASGTPMIVPDRGAAAGPARPGRRHGLSRRERNLARARDPAFIERGPELQRAAAVRRLARTMDEHFADLFARYEALAPGHSVAVARVDEEVSEAAIDLCAPCGTRNLTLSAAGVACWPHWPQVANGPGRSASKSVGASPIAMVVTNPQTPDNPIEIANAAFCRLTGYTEGEIVGRNCRFLAGDDTEPSITRPVRAAIDARRPVLVDILNYRRDGTPFRNGVMIAPLFNEDGQLTCFLGSQVDLESDDAAALSVRRARAAALIEQLPSGSARCSRAWLRGCSTSRSPMSSGSPKDGEDAPRAAARAAWQDY